MTGHEPKVFRLERADNAVEVQLTEDADVFGHGLAAGLPETTDETTQFRKTSSRIGAALRWALGMLFSLWLGVYGYHFIEDLFRTHIVLGWIGAGVAAVAILAAFVLLVREWRALARLDNLAKLRADIATATLGDDRDAARALTRRLIGLYVQDAGSAAQRAEMEEHIAAIIDGPDLLRIAERVLLKSRDAQVRRAIATAAKRVSLITALSPRAVVDILFAGAQAIRLTRQIAEIYGGRPGVFGFLRLGRKVFSHLAITGGMAVTDSVLSQMLGAGIVAKLSAKLGEGMLNGILTARVGLAAIAVCRPMPFLDEPELKLSDVVTGLMKNKA